uniref:Uncharacterized protein n=1 Tax=Anopheles dirus TaxID=7168 RepID=A0A182NXX6_9DIPT
TERNGLSATLLRVFVARRTRLPEVRVLTRTPRPRCKLQTTFGGRESEEQILQRRRSGAGPTSARRKQKQNNIKNHTLTCGRLQRKRTHPHTRTCTRCVDKSWPRNVKPLAAEVVVGCAW